LQGSNAELFVEDKYLNFGTAWETTKFSWKLPFVNQSERQVEILDFESVCSSCTPVIVRPSSFVLKPGERREAELILDLTRRGSGQEQSWERPFQATIGPHFKEMGEQRIRWKITGNVRQALRTVPAVVDLGDREPESPAEGESFSIECHPRVGSVHVSCDSAFVNVHASRVVDGKSTVQVNVLAGELRKLNAGSFRARVSLTPKDSSGEVLPSIPFDVFGNVVYDVVVSPEDLVPGALRLGAKCAESLTFRSRSGKPFDVQARASNKSITVVETGSTGQGDRVFQLFVEATKVGPQTERIQFTVKTRGAERPVDFHIGVKYHGIP
jgi:hypothetical protein